MAESGTLTANAYFELTLPSRDYIVRGVLAGYRTSCRVCRVEPGRETWCSQFLERGTGEERCQAPPRSIDAGPWPTGLDAGVLADGGPPRIAGGCAVAPGQAPSLALCALLALALARARRR